MADRILGWKLAPDGRAALLARFRPRYARTIAEHVTFAKKADAPPMPAASGATVVGRADDSAGVEALVVEIAGTTERWDGGTYHVTWSLGPGRDAVESNRVIAESGWQPTAPVPEVGLTAAEWQ